MAVGIYSISVSIAGYSFSKSVTRTADHPNPYEVTLPVAHALTNWVKTDADTAAGDLTAGHGLSTGTFDIYWDGGARYDVPCTITTNAVALDGGAGDDFPASATTTVRMSPRTQINTAIDGDEIELAFIKCVSAAGDSTERIRLLFEDATGDDIADLDDADGLGVDQTVIYDIAGGDTNPFTGDQITVCHASQSSTSATCVLSIVTLEDSTP